MSGRERRKGVAGEREVLAIYREAGLEVRGLEATGDHLVIGGCRVLHSESKRQEVWRPHLWIAQAEQEAPASTVPVVAMRRSRGRWYGLLPLEDLAFIVHESREART